MDSRIKVLMAGLAFIAECFVTVIPAHYHGGYISNAHAQWVLEVLAEGEFGSSMVLIGKLKRALEKGLNHKREQIR